MGGFTAINSSGPAPAAPLNHTGGISSVPEMPSSERNVTIASVYLGRSHQGPPAAAKLAPKRTSVRGKKRATTAPDTKNAKRRKTSNVSDATPAAKLRTASKEQSTAKSKVKDPGRTDQTALQHKQPVSSANVNQKDSQHAKQSTADEVNSTSAPTLLSVIAPSTSMGALHNDSQQTSFNAAKSSSGRRTILYSTTSNPTKQQSSTQLQKPLPSKAQRSPAKKTNKASDACDMTEDAHQFDEHGLADDDDNFAILSNELAQQIEGNTTQDSAPRGADTRRTTRSATKKLRQQPAFRQAQSIEDEYCFIDDDDGLAEAMAQAEKATQALTTTKEKSRTAKQLPTPENSDTVEPSTKNAEAQSSRSANEDPDGDVMIIPSDDEDEDMIEFDKATRAAEKAGLKPRVHKQNIRVVGTHEDYGGALLDDAEKQLLDKLKSATLTSTTKPIVRSSFSPPVLDRSPIFGATNTTLLRTCFRLGEALNVGSHAVRTSTNLILEIYARITSSFREGRKQHFVFRDLYHDKPPHLQGDFELWGQSRLWEVDGKAFMGAAERMEGVMCRAVTRMKRDGAKWRLEVLSIWEAGWEDVQAVAGIYGKGADGWGGDED